MALTYVADVSALSRLHHDDVRARVEPLFLHGRVALCRLTWLELLSRCRRQSDHAEVLEDLGTLPVLPTGEEVLARAIEVQTLLATTGRHRAVGPSELVVAASAELSGAVVLHYDPAFDLVAEATGQPTEWVATRGTVP
ncbi:MAG: PIN domain-containing protein [Acidimicrobiia bacterium]